MLLIVGLKNKIKSRLVGSWQSGWQIKNIISTELFYLKEF